MKKETREWIMSWCYVIWFAHIIASTIYIYFVRGWGIDLQFMLAVDIIFAVPLAYFLVKSIKNKEFRLKKPGVMV